jgi:glycosyltransferase involved in cell wall biosynthesis
MKPRGLMVIHNFRPGPVGGAELQAERLAGQLASMGHNMQVFTWLMAPDAPLEEICNSVLIHRAPFRLPYWVKRDNANTFRFLVRERKTYDILHVHMALGHAVVAVVVARCFKKRCIIKIACAGPYGDLCRFSEFDWFDKALGILKQADAIVAVSTEVKQELLQYGFPPQRIVRISNGVDTVHFAPSPKSFCNPEKTRFILVGRRHPQKGIDTTLEAARRLKEDGLGKCFEVCLYGSDYREYDYVKMAREMKVDDVVEFFPFQANIVPIYDSAHCLLLPSRGEGLSNSLLEAMSMELPVIATRVSGVEDVISDNEDGILISDDAPDMLAAAMARIISDPNRSRQLGIKARHKVNRLFSLASVAKSYSDLYQALYAGRRKGA